MKLKSNKDVVVRSQVVFEEDLPFPYVHYPNLYGVFIGFGKSRDVFPKLCLCAKSAVELALSNRERFKDYGEASVRAPASSKLFPVEISIRSIEMGERAIEYAPSLCHRCNLAIPSVSYCAPMYGGLFKQSFGWYIEQTQYRLGIDGDVFSDACPENLKMIGRRITDLSKERNTIADSWGQLYRRLTDDFDNNIDLFQKLENPTPELELEIEQLSKLNDKKSALEKEISKLSRKHRNIIENETRKEFGFRKIGEGWIGESLLAKIVQTLFPFDKIHRHHRPTWLEGLELDIFVNSKKLAFEYQGQQHYRPVKHWGGQAAFQKGLERDAKKRKICRKLGIKLVEISFRDPLTVEFVKSKIPSEFFNEGLF